MLGHSQTRGQRCTWSRAQKDRNFQIFDWLIAHHRPGCKSASTDRVLPPNPYRPRDYALRANASSSRIYAASRDASNRRSPTQRVPLLVSPDETYNVRPFPFPLRPTLLSPYGTCCCCGSMVEAGPAHVGTPSTQAAPANGATSANNASSSSPLSHLPPQVQQQLAGMTKERLQNMVMVRVSCVPADNSVCSS